jgi:hypothetical protein
VPVVGFGAAAFSVVSVAFIISVFTLELSPRRAQSRVVAAETVTRNCQAD